MDIKLIPVEKGSKFTFPALPEKVQGKYAAKGDFYCYEVKSSVEDFHSKNGHNFLGDYNYYVMPEEVYEQIKKEIPYQVGVYVPDGMNYRGEWYDLKAIKKAKRKDRSRPVSEMLLMMFRSAARDRKKALSDGY